MYSGEAEDVKESLRNPERAIISLSIFVDKEMQLLSAKDFSESFSAWTSSASVLQMPVSELYIWSVSILPLPNT